MTEVVRLLTYLAELLGVVGLVGAPAWWLLSGGGAAPAVPSEHRRRYRFDISDWWCDDCETITDWCQQLNPH